MLKQGDFTLENIRLETIVKEIESLKVLELVGEIDVYTAPSFRGAVVNLLDSGVENLIIDMSGVHYMDSSGFGILLSATKRLKPEGGNVYLVHCSSAIERVLRITKLDTVFGIHNNIQDVAKAIKS